MIGSGRAGDIRVVVITERELARISKVVRDIFFQKLLFDRSGFSLEPGCVSMNRVLFRRIGRVRHFDALCTGKSPEVIVESVVFLEQDDNMLNWAGHRGTSLIAIRS